MVASLFSRPKVHRRRSFTDSSSSSSKKQSKMSSFGAMIRRVGGSQGSLEQQQQPLESQSERGIGGFMRRAKSLGGLDRCNSSKPAVQAQPVEDDGPSGVTSFLQHIEPPQAPTKCAPEKPVSKVDAPADRSKQQGGMIRGLIRRAASLRTMKSKEPAPPREENLEPVLVLTNENHGRVVFQNLDLETMDLSSSPSYGQGSMHSSLPDLSLSLSSRSSRARDSPTSKLHSSCSFHTARTSASTGGTIDSSYFFLDLSTQDLGEQSLTQQNEEDLDEASRGLRGRIQTLFQKPLSGEETPEADHSAGGETTTEGSSSSSGSSTSSPPMHTVVAQHEQEDLLTSKQYRCAPQSSFQDIALPSLMEDEVEIHDSTRRRVVDLAEASGFMEGLLEVVEQYEDYEKERSASSTDEIEDVDVYDEEPPPLEFPVFMDIHVEAQPARVYDELERFYEEATFAHVGGSMLLGSASELMTVPEYEEEDYADETEEGEEEDDLDQVVHEESLHDRISQGSLMRSYLPPVEEGMDESFSSSHCSEGW